MRLHRFVVAVACLVALAFVLVEVAPAVAQPKPPAKAKFAKKTVIDFDDDTIEGDLSRPDGEYLETRKRRKFANLIKIRGNFRQEILQSVRGL